MHFFGCKIKYSYRLKGCQTTAQVSQARRIVLAGGNIPPKHPALKGVKGKSFVFISFHLLQLPHFHPYMPPSGLYFFFWRLYQILNRVYQTRLIQYLLLNVSSDCVFLSSIILQKWVRLPISQKAKWEFSSLDLLHLLWVKVQFKCAKTYI